MMGPHGTIILCPSIWAKACESDSGLGIFENDNNVGGSFIVDYTRSLGEIATGYPVLVAFGTTSSTPGLAG